MSEVAKKIKQARLEADLTQEQFSELIGVNQVTVAKWETGLHRPKRGMLSKIAKALNRSPDWFTLDNRSPIMVEAYTAIERRLKQLEESVKRGPPGFQPMPELKKLRELFLDDEMGRALTEHWEKASVPLKAFVLMALTGEREQWAELLNGDETDVLRALEAHKVLSGF